MVALPGSLAMGQETPAPTPPQNPPPNAQPSLENRPQIVAPQEKQTKDQLEHAERPNPPNRPATPGTVKDLVKDFQAAREAYLAQQKELRRQLNEATAEQREAIREKLKENLAAWLEVQRARVQELREQIRETKQAIQGYDKVIDAAQEKGRRP
jgi:hypothetical protein